MKFLKKFLSPDVEGGDYGYASDEVKISPFNFGGNFGNCYLTKFEWIPNGGKDGAEQEALDIVFNINKVDKNYRMFPVTKVFSKDGGAELTDTTTEEYKKARQEAIQDFNARITHILHAFQDHDTVKAALSRGFKSFKEFCQACMNLLPTNFKEQPLDIFLQYQWSPSEGQERTYLDVPKKMKYGAWLKKAIPGTWTEHRITGTGLTDDVRKALWYTNENNEEHPFVKNGWFMLSNFANLQSKAGTGASSEGGSAMNAGAQVSSPSSTPQSGTTPTSTASAW